MKRYLSHPPILSRLERKEVLYAYVVVIDHSVSLVLVRMKNGVQKLVYYVSKSLQEAETRYFPLEKAVLTIIHATRKLPHYFQSHTIVVLIEFPLQVLLWKSNLTGRIAKWGTMLGVLYVKYMPCNAIKGQVLVDFVAKFTKDIRRIKLWD